MFFSVNEFFNYFAFSVLFQQIQYMNNNTLYESKYEIFAWHKSVVNI